MGLFWGKHWDPRGKHCYVTGGSSGTGHALAVLLAKKGAHVSIVARNEERLRQVTAEMETARMSADQTFTWHSYSLTSAQDSASALDAASAAHGRCPDAVFLCAGASKPGFFVEEDEASLRAGMDSAYWVQAWTALAAAKRMVRDGVRGKIAFVSSVVGYMSIVGYSNYAPGKHALRGLAETLRCELRLYDIGVHICFPGTILSPMLAEENKTKPQVTKKIEETDAGLPPLAIAMALLQGVESGHFHISVDLITHIFRASTRGSTPWNSIFDFGYELIGSVALMIWRRSVDREVWNHRAEHRTYLEARGLVGGSKSSTDLQSA